MVNSVEFGDSDEPDVGLGVHAVGVDGADVGVLVGFGGAELVVGLESRHVVLFDLDVVNEVLQLWVLSPNLDSALHAVRDQGADGDVLEVLEADVGDGLHAVVVGDLHVDVGLAVLVVDVALSNINMGLVSTVVDISKLKVVLTMLVVGVTEGLETNLKQAIWTIGSVINSNFLGFFSLTNETLSVISTLVVTNMDISKILQTDDHDSSFSWIGGRANMSMSSLWVVTNLNSTMVSTSNLTNRNSLQILKSSNVQMSLVSSVVTLTNSDIRLSTMDLSLANICSCFESIVVNGFNVDVSLTMFIVNN